MTEKEAIEVLKDFDSQVTAKADGAYQSTIGKMACDTAIKALEEIQQYWEIGTVEEIKDLLVTISEASEDVDESGISVGLIKALLELSEYRKIGTVEECRAAVEKLPAAEETIRKLLCSEYGSSCQFCIHDNDKEAMCCKVGGSAQKYGENKRNNTRRGRNMIEK